ncbi:hypothetical protein [uncultured Roseibium sp.]
MGADDLHKVGADEGVRERDLQGAEELRQRLRQRDLPEDLRLGSAE